MEKKYDIFISHSSYNKTWVRILAGNLENQGLKVFFDKWALAPGESLVYTLNKAIEESRGAILVITPEAMNSGWVKKEYSKIITYQTKNPDYVLIPLLLAGSPDFPFSDEIVYVDFRNPDKYKDSFASIISGLEKGIPGFSGKETVPIKIPELPSPHTFTLETNQKEKAITDIFRKIEVNKQPVMVLFQAFKDQEQVIQEILNRAKTTYNEEAVIHVIPPYGEHTETQSYFSFIGRQCCLQADVVDGPSFESAMDHLVTKKGTVFLLISGFEHGSYEHTHQLAGSIRNLNQHYPDKLPIVLCGGQILKEQKFKNEQHSLLNIADIIEWPDPGIEDTLEFVGTNFPELHLDKNRIDSLLTITGGHTGLIKEALFLLSDSPDLSDEEVKKKLSESSLVGQVFHSVIDGDKNLIQLKEILDKEEIYPYDSFLHNDLLRTLYWKNLLCWKERDEGKYLAWRSPLIRETGMRIVKNYETK